MVGLALEGVRERRSMGVDLDQSTLYEILSKLIKISLKSWTIASLWMLFWLSCFLFLDPKTFPLPQTK